jgi:uncharacterized protein YjdB
VTNGAAGGQVNAIAPGSTFIIATSGTVTAQVAVTVRTATLNAITISPPNPSVVFQQSPGASQQTQQFTAAGSYSDGSSQDISAGVIWTSSDSSKATINQNGLATAIAPGSSQIRAAFAGITGQTGLTVTSPTLQSITVTPVSPNVAVGQPIRFTATGEFSDGSIQDVTSSASWTSANPAVAAIAANTGIATAQAAGSSVITATSGAISEAVTLNVVGVNLTALTVAPANPTLQQGDAQQFSATGTFSDGTTEDLTASVTWNSADPRAATISPNGLLKALTAGALPVLIEAVLGPGPITGETSVTISPATLVSIQLQPQNASIASGQTQQFAATGIFSDGTQQDLTSSVTWSSGTPAVASVTRTGGLATAVAAGGTLTLFANNPGTWGNNLQVQIIVQANQPSRFTLQVLQVLDANTSRVLESFPNLSVAANDPRYVVTIIDNDSQ